jgi:hypothetical protein
MTEIERWRLLPIGTGDRLAQCAGRGGFWRSGGTPVANSFCGYAYKNVDADAGASGGSYWFAFPHQLCATESKAPCEPSYSTRDLVIALATDR